MDIVLQLVLLFAGLFIVRRRPKWIAVFFLAFGVYFTVWSLWQGRFGSQFVGGEEVTGRVVDKHIEEGLGGNYVVTVAWLGKDGVEHSRDIKTMANFFGYYEAGQKVELVLSKQSAELAVMKTDLKFLLSVGPIYVMPAIFFGLGGIGAALLMWFYADRIRNSFKDRYHKKSDDAAGQHKKWRWDDEP